MESSGSRSEVGEGGVAILRKSLPQCSTLTLPPRNPGDSFLKSSDGSTPSPMTLVPSLWTEDLYTDSSAFSQLLVGAMASPTTLFGEGLGEPGLSSDSDHGRMVARNTGAKVDGGLESPECIRSNTARFKAMVPSRIPISRPPIFTVPPGLSPTTLLDSPVLLRTGQAEPSPTTGSFHSYLQESPESQSFKERKTEEDSFVFKPQPQLARNPLPPLPSMGFFGNSYQQAVSQAPTKAQVQVSSGIFRAGTLSVSESASMLTSMPSFSVANLVAPSQTQEIRDSVMEEAELSEEVPTSQMQAPTHPPPVLVERPSEDGYNWRKYGQKQVKGSEYPRSYYKCTNPNCPVKKKVERSYDGQVTEIVYKGEHNHAKPQATRRGMSSAHNIEGALREVSHLGIWEGAETSNGAGKPDSSRISADPSQSRDQSIPYTGGLAGTPEPSLASTSDDEGEDGEASKAEDGDEDEHDSKRRRVEMGPEAMGVAPLRTIREPRVVVQTTSEVDILDDGYRWRKYGQKVVKGNPHPRSYYKCTNSGCTVRKLVERSSTDPKAVITTYEGKHNHDVPAARNSNHDTSGAAAASAPPPSGTARLAVSNANALVRPSLSLQEQFIGRNFEESFRTGDKMAGGVDLGGGGFINEVIPAQSSSRGADISSQSAMRTMSSSLTGLRQPEGCELAGQVFGLKPKEEPGDVLPFGSSLQPVLSSGSSYAV